ncbi:MAG: TonB-dependent receptor plug domain-containing protein, partial [Candidatus Cloacimonetes bacterium]|nr:TonB-dependent receptor plug domain-containing protein [Candidatus Cloacimonadota bacterium]
MKLNHTIAILFIGLLSILPSLGSGSPLSSSGVLPTSPIGRDSLKTYYLPTVKVIVSKPSEAIGALHLIDASDKQSSLNLREMLSQSLGVSASTGSKDESNLRLRGFRKNEVKIMIDGRPLNSGYFGNVDLSKLSLLNIAEIQIIKGPTSPLYGSNSMGGILNLITKEPSRNTWLQLGGVIKRNNTQELRIGSAHSFDTYSYQLGLSREHTDGFV